MRPTLTGAPGLKRLAALLFALAAAPALPAPPILPAQGSIQMAFTPGDDAAGLVIEAIGQARHQVLVQTYSFTHPGIADALIAAHARGLDVRVIADRDQHDAIDTSRIDYLAEQGVPVYLDGEHAAAHSKVMVIDAGEAGPAVITGSFNFTSAAQYRNAENLLILRGNPALAAAYAADWQRHLAHSIPLRP